MSELPSLIPALPEIILAVGAMALLMVGAFGGERTNLLVSAAAIGLLVVAGANEIEAAEASILAPLSTDGAITGGLREVAAAALLPAHEPKIRTR